jgi:hypothetical protein
LRAVGNTGSLNRVRGRVEGSGGSSSERASASVAPGVIEERRPTCLM